MAAHLPEEGPGTAFLTAFDHEEIRRLEAQGAAKRVKREWIEKGYTHQMSLYGASYNDETDKHTVRRIEILCDVAYTKELLASLVGIFERIIPPFKYSIWVCNGDLGQLAIAGGYN